MKYMMLFATCAVTIATACSSSSSPGGGSGGQSAASSLVGSWQVNSNSGDLAIVLHIEADGTYESNVVTFVSSDSWQDQIERGTYVVSGPTMTATPKQWSCPGPDPIANFDVAFSNSNLIVTNAKGEVLVYPPQPAADRAPPAGVIIAVGCYGSTGFTAMPLSPVGN